MRTIFYTISLVNGEQLTNELFNSEEEALRFLDVRALTDKLYKIEKLYCHESPYDPDRQRRANLWSMTAEEKIAKRQELIKAKALKK
jgi:hypothetical protein